MKFLALVLCSLALHVVALVYLVVPKATPQVSTQTSHSTLFEFEVDPKPTQAPLMAQEKKVPFKVQRPLAANTVLKEPIAQEIFESNAVQIDSAYSADIPLEIGSMVASDGNAQNAMNEPPHEDFAKVTRLVHERLKLAAAQCYPKAAQRFRLQGRTVVNFCISTNGTVESISVRVSSGQLTLDEAATHCVMEHSVPFSIEAHNHCFEGQVDFSP